MPGRAPRRVRGCLRIVVQPDRDLAGLLGALLAWEVLLRAWPDLTYTVLRVVQVGALYVVARG
jgi:hypothetical protein